MTAADPVPTVPAPAVLSVRDLHIAFPDGSAGGQEVVHGVDLDLRSGSVLALVGESGSGKSVTAMATIRLLAPQARIEGTVTFDGHDLLTAPADVLRAVRGDRIGVVFQEPMASWNPVQRIGAQIVEALRAHRSMPASSARERVLDLLESAGLDEPARIASAYPHQLSGGQLQRAMIAMATSNDPDVLIADEPTTALDVTVQAGILDLLRGLAAQGTAILLITHDMGVVADLADLVVVLHDGVVVERGTVDRVLTTPEDAYTRDLLAAVPRLSELGVEPGPRQTGERPLVTATGADRAGASHDGDVVARLYDVQVVYPGSRGLLGGSAAVRAVDGVDLDLHAGRTLGLVGESGCGKSTIGRCLTGLLRPTGGTVAVGGADLTALSGRALRRVQREVGIVFQDPGSSLNPKHAVGRSIAEPLRLAGWNRTDADARVDDLLEAVQLDPTMKRRYPHQLSGGQRQRAAIARALALRPRVLIADEPTSALDVSVQAHILDLIRDLQADLGFACLFISHDLAVVAAIAHDVAVMRGGRLVEAGSADAVLTNPQDGYTARLLASAPVADPGDQRRRRQARLALVSAGIGQPLPS